ncbi:MAG: hypothetical protein AB7P21_28105 [Lautropia sp.]
MTHAPSPSSTLWRRWAPGVWLACFAASLLLFRIPLLGDDQALFGIGAQILRDGGVLYRDFWDVKQPGIYWFNQAALALPGAGGRHWLLVVWLATTGLASAVLAAIAAPYTGAWLFAPLLTLGTCLLVSDPSNIGQLETLVPLPITGVIVCVLGVAARRIPLRGGWLAAGVLTGVTALFKLILASIPATILLIALARLGFQRGARATALAFAMALLGAALVAAATIAPFAAAGALEPMLWTQFAWPVQALGAIGHAPVSRLLDAAAWFAGAVALMLPAAWVGLRGTLARRMRRRDAPPPSPQGDPGSPASLGLADRDLPIRSLAGACLAAWLLVDLAAIAAQQLSWHAYHFTLLIWPIGMLAALGAGQAIQRRGSRVALWVLVLALAVNLLRFGYRQWAPPEPPIEPRHYVAKLPALAAQLARSPCRTAIVFGSPALLLATGLSPAGALTGQLAPILLPVQWRQLEDTIRDTRPGYLYLHAGAPMLIGAKRQALERLIERDYRVLATDAMRGVWMVPVTGACAG